MLNKFKAFMLGVSDGFSQPYSLTTSHNIDHLSTDETYDRVQNTLDLGINIGQFLRAGTSSEAFRERMAPFNRKGV